MRTISLSNLSLSPSPIFRNQYFVVILFFLFQMKPFWMQPRVTLFNLQAILQTTLWTITKYGISNVPMDSSCPSSFTISILSSKMIIFTLEMVQEDSQTTMIPGMLLREICVRSETIGILPPSNPRYKSYSLPTSSPSNPDFGLSYGQWNKHVRIKLNSENIW